MQSLNENTPIQHNIINDNGNGESPDISSHVQNNQAIQVQTSSMS